MSGAPAAAAWAWSSRPTTFAYTPDRTRLFIARGTRTGNMVLIRDFQ